MPETLDGSLMALLADTARGTMTLLLNLHSNPKVAKVTRGMDVVTGQSSLTKENSYTFESYVETETHDGEQFYWLLDISKVPGGWLLERDISKQFDGGTQTVRDFEDFRCEHFDELAKNHANLMNEFIKSADNFDFSQ